MCELRAQAHLENQRIRTFLPKRHKTMRHAWRLRTVEAAFFPRYLFVILDLTRQEWRRINGTVGVSSMSMRGDQPHPVSRGIVEALIAFADAGGILQLGEQLKLGGPVGVMAEPFAEQLAILESMDDAGRVRVLFAILGRKVSIDTHSNNVLPLA